MYLDMQPWMDVTQYPDASSCALDSRSWEELINMRTTHNVTLSSGSLGPKAISGVYDTWVCIKGHEPWLRRCGERVGALPGDPFCFVFQDTGDFIHGTFRPWGSNKSLKLVKSTCKA
jgi:hypothetical protein